MMRFGLCCQFLQQPIKFVTTTATSLAKLKKFERSAKLSRLCLANAEALHKALEYCAQHQIGCFRINSQILPCKTHPDLEYDVHELPEGEAIVRKFKECGEFAKKHDLRTCFHPDQFVVLNSLRADVVEKSIKELEYHAEVAEWVEADVINIHGGGAFGDKPSALAKLQVTIELLSPRIRQRLTLENDDRVFSPADLLDVCRNTGLPFVYDVHHHRCLQDSLTIERATEAAIKTWDREPLFHISSPIEGWTGSRPERHHDFIDVGDFPDCWLDKSITVEIEAKAKEAAVSKIMTKIRERVSKNRKKKK